MDTGDFIWLMVGVIYDMSIVFLFITLLSLIIYTRRYNIAVAPFIIACNLWLAEFETLAFDIIFNNFVLLNMIISMAEVQKRAIYWMMLIDTS